MSYFICVIRYIIPKDLNYKAYHYRVVVNIPKKTIMFWLGLQIVFLIVFVITFISIKSQQGVLGIMPYEAEDYSVMFLSVLGMIKCLYEIF